VLFDPTRRLENTKKFHLFDRKEVEMHHLTFVRKDIKMKMMNVSNRANYNLANVDNFVDQFEKWTPEKGILHPHPRINYVQFFHILVCVYKNPRVYMTGHIYRTNFYRDRGSA
jgi:hypothetical protein